MDINYRDLVNLIDNSGLVPGEEYSIRDYPSYKVVIKAKTENTLEKSGWCSVNGTTYTIYYELTDGSDFGWQSDRGWVYYMCDPNNKISAYFDFLSNIEDSSDVVVNESRDENGKLIIPEIFIKDSRNINIGYNCDRIVVNTCKDVRIGDMNEQIDLVNSNNITIGDMNLSLSTYNTSNANIRDLNLDIYIDDATGVKVGTSNYQANIWNEGNILGNRNFGVEVEADATSLGNLSKDIKIKNQLNEVNKSAFITAEGIFDLISGCQTITTDSDCVGNHVEGSESVDLKGIRNNHITTNRLQLDWTAPFCGYVDDNGKRVYTNRLNKTLKIADSRGVVLDQSINRLEEAKQGNTDYVMNGGIWEALIRPGKPMAEGRCRVIITAPAELSRLATFHGDGEYDRGDTAEVYARGEGYTITAWIESVSGQRIEGSVVEVVCDTNKILTPIYSLV